jgi:pseudouridine-5'-phosphate glycosidase
MQLSGAVLIANPIPVTEEIPADIIETTILQALAAANEANILGKNLTPFLLKYIADHTKGESLSSNIALIKNNAKLGAEIAVAYSTLAIY